MHGSKFTKTFQSLTQHVSRQPNKIANVKDIDDEIFGINEDTLHGHDSTGRRFSCRPSVPPFVSGIAVVTYQV